ncbi:DNA polymerase III subunit epsilon [Wolbachia endosymbiont of Pentidionis agamae]|uniref:DNA polymerase III subunit epsilon n=1 Tax=Wolbachia endosymbiont of Pentidionis agamae TaxID=3110435 RepID=UPI0038CD153E
MLDTETTGLDTNSGHRIIEIGCVELINRIPTGNVFHQYINPERNIPYHSFKIHGISEEFVKNKPVFSKIAKSFLEFISNDILVIHNAEFDIRFLNMELHKVNTDPILHDRVIDTLDLARRKFIGSPASLNALCKRFNISLDGRELHGALIDAKLLAKVYVELTGGLQNLLFEKTDKGMSSKKINPKYIKNNRTYNQRQHSPSQDEIKAHNKLLTQMKDPLWLQRTLE